MNDKKIHQFLISISIISFVIAGVITWYLLRLYPDRYWEGNPLSAIGFKYIGIAPTLLILWAILTTILINTPKIFGKYKKMCIICDVCFAIISLLDAGNNLYWLFQEFYWIFGDVYQFFTPAVTILNILYHLAGIHI